MNILGWCSWPCVPEVLGNECKRWDKPGSCVYDWCHTLRQHSERKSSSFFPFEYYTNVIISSYLWSLSVFGLDLGNADKASFFYVTKTCQFLCSCANCCHSSCHIRIKWKTSISVCLVCTIHSLLMNAYILILSLFTDLRCSKIHMRFMYLPFKVYSLKNNKFVNRFISGEIEFSQFRIQIF